MNVRTQALTAVSAVSAVSWRSYLKLCKPKVVSLVVFTAMVAMLLAEPSSGVSWSVLLSAVVGIAQLHGSFLSRDHRPQRLTAALQTLTKRYRVGYSYGKPDALGNYVVNHSCAVFMFDANGKARLLIDQGKKVDQITSDIKQLVAQSAG